MVKKLVTRVSAVTCGGTSGGKKETNNKQYRQPKNNKKISTAENNNCVRDIQFRSDRARRNAGYSVNTVRKDELYNFHLHLTNSLYFVYALCYNL